jgi:hypothetical protein
MQDSVSKPRPNASAQPGGGAVGCVKHGAIVKRKPPQPRHMREAGPIG